MDPSIELTPLQKQKSLLKSLLQEKEDLDEKIKDHVEALDNMKVGVSGSLIDEEGFPIPNVDHYTIRKMRGEVNAWMNDMKALVKHIEVAIHKLHQLAQKEQENEGVESGNESGTSDTASQEMHKEETQVGTRSGGKIIEVEKITNKPFLFVADVHSGSPAFEAGLKEGDLITQLGTINADSVRRKGMSIIASLVEDSLNRPLSIQVRRKDEFLRLQLIPHTWEGRGYLGCLIRPYES